MKGNILLGILSFLLLFFCLHFSLCEKVSFIERDLWLLKLPSCLVTKSNLKYFVNIMQSAFHIYIVGLESKLFLLSKTVWIKCIPITIDFNILSFRI